MFNPFKHPVISLILIVVLLSACAPAASQVPPAKDNSPVPTYTCAAKIGESGGMHVVKIHELPEQDSVDDMVFYIAATGMAPAVEEHSIAFSEFLGKITKEGDRQYSVDAAGVITGECPASLGGERMTMKTVAGDILMVNMENDMDYHEPHRTGSLLFYVNGPDASKWFLVQSYIWNPDIHASKLQADFTDALWQPELNFTCGSVRYTVIAQRGAGYNGQNSRVELDQLMNMKDSRGSIERTSATQVRFACAVDNQTYYLNDVTASDFLMVQTRIELFWGFFHKVIVP